MSVKAELGIFTNWMPQTGRNPERKKSQTKTVALGIMTEECSDPFYW